MARIGVVLSGCGHQDGAEIHETVIAMLSLEEAGAELICISLDKSQTKVVNHLKREPVNEQRNVMIEAARIARGNIKCIKDVYADDLDALVIPGGLGAAMNLCDFAEQGSKMKVDPDLERLLRALHEQKKPLGAICIAPVILAKVFGPLNPKVTIGKDQAVAYKIEEMGATHVNCSVDDCVIDEDNLLVTSPAYMLAKSIKDLHEGIRKLSDAVVSMIPDGKYRHDRPKATQ